MSSNRWQYKCKLLLIVWGAPRFQLQGSIFRFPLCVLQLCCHYLQFGGTFLLLCIPAQSLPIPSAFLTPCENQTTTYDMYLPVGKRLHMFAILSEL